MIIWVSIDYTQSNAFSVVVSMVYNQQDSLNHVHVYFWTL